MSVPAAQLDTFPPSLPTDRAGVQWRPAPTLPQRLRAAIGDALRALNGSAAHLPVAEPTLASQDPMSLGADSMGDGGFADTLPLWKEGVDPASVGLSIKYIVQRVDGSDAPGGRHHGNDLFVLDLTDDPYAKEAIRHYALACAGDLPLLAADLFARYGKPPIPVAASVVDTLGPELLGLLPDQIDTAAPPAVASCAEPANDDGIQGQLFTAEPAPAIKLPDAAQHESAAPASLAAAPLNMLLFCPKCHTQHIDAPSPGWTNPPHRTHQCHACNTHWRPADVPTNGVAQIVTRGSSDTWPEPAAAAPAGPLQSPCVATPDQPPLE